MSGRRSSRRNEPAARSGLGALSRSPAKQRDTHNRTQVVGIGRTFKRQILAAQLDALLDGPSAADLSRIESPQTRPSDNDVEMEDGWVDEPPPLPLPPPAPTLPAPTQVFVVHPDNKHESTVKAWGALLPRLERPFLQYRRDTHGRVPPIIPTEVINACGAACAEPYTLLIQCLYPTHYKTYIYAARPLRGLTTNLGMRAVDPFRSALSNAVLWSSNLQTRLDARVSAALADAATALGLQSTASSVPSSPPGSTPAHADADAASAPASNDPTSAPLPSNNPASAPASNHPVPPAREQTSAPPARASAPLASNDPASAPASNHPVPPTREQTSAPAREQTTDAATSPASDDHNPRVNAWACRPDFARAVPGVLWARNVGRPLKEGDVQLGGDGCFSYRHLKSAGDGPISYTPDYFIPKEKMIEVKARIDAAKKRPPAKVLFLCNIDTPGEQQQYIVAGLEVVQEHLPPQATILQNYNVGCLTDHSCNLFPLLTPGLRERVGFAINAMHAYGHQWAALNCIQNSRRIWMIDLYMSFINAEASPISVPGCSARRLAKATKMLRDCRVPTAELRSEWAAQKVAQSSIRAQTHQALSEQAESLYASLNISTAFPELRNLPLEFVRTLLMMRDLKMNIRKRTVGSFQEWEMLDRAVSGRREPLGTKLYQMTRKAITRRQPALTRALKKFNGYCARLELLRPPGCNIPIPAALPTTLDGLHSDPSLHQDVWIQSSNEPVPRWLEDHDMRDGIRSLHIIDRCAEETDRLNLERRNLDLWLKEELAVVAKVISSANDPDLHLPLVQRQQELEYLRRLWGPALCLRPRPQAIAATSASATTSGASTTGPRTAAPSASTTISRAVPSHSATTSGASTTGPRTAAPSASTTISRAVPSHSGECRPTSYIVGLLLPQPKPVKRDLCPGGEVPAPSTVQSIKEELLLLGERERPPLQDSGVERRKADVGAGRRRRWRGTGCSGVVPGAFPQIPRAPCSNAHLFPAK
ncbi:hypothetical protein B0H13DRAFT_1917602 [Mycena leptocephala]|nr:hypothetical protein B0H13DRAFT_1917602 [Mycena leptocephala]